MVVSIKVQKLPSLVASNLGKDSYLIVLAYLVVNILLILLAFYILKKTKNKSLNQTKSVVAKFFVKIFMIFVVVYFLSQSLLLYETIQNLFAHVLFYNLPWTLFSLMLTVTVFYLAQTGITNIARNFELYFVIIIASYLIISIFGGMHTDFTVIFPFETINIKNVLSSMFKFNLWFGDFFFVLFLGKKSQNIKLKWTLLTYFLAMIFVTILYVEFVGIYQAYAPLKPSLISVISEQSMLGINIGRVDWFLILATEIGTILSCSVCLYYAKVCFGVIFEKVNKNYLLLFLSAVLYLTDVLYLVDTHSKEMLFLNFITHLSLAVKVLFLVVLLFYCFSLSKKSERKLLKRMEDGSWKN